MLSNLEAKRQKLFTYRAEIEKNRNRSNFLTAGCIARKVLEDIILWLQEEVVGDSPGKGYSHGEFFTQLNKLTSTKNKVLDARLKSLAELGRNIFNPCCHGERLNEPPPTYEMVTEALNHYLAPLVTWFETKYLDSSPISADVRFSRLEPGKYSGRGPDLEKLHTLLHQNIRPVVISGPTGVGKTELAREYADHYRDEYPGGIVWIDARGTPAELLQQIEAAFRRYRSADPLSEMEATPEPEKTAQIYWRSWRPGRRLLVFDNVPGDGVNATSKFFPDSATAPEFDILVTSQKNWPRAGGHVLGELTEEESVDLFRAFLGPERVNAELDAAIQTVQWLGCLPIALELTARFMMERREELFEDVLDRLKEEGAVGEVLATEGNAVQRNWLTSFRLMWNSLLPAEQQMLHLIACLPAGPVAKRLMTEVYEKARPAQGARPVRDASSKLMAWNVLKNASGEDGRIEIHDLIRLSTRQMTGIDQRTMQTPDESRTFEQAADLRQALGKLMHESASAFLLTEGSDRLPRWREYVQAWTDAATQTSIVPSSADATDILLGATEYRYLQGAATEVVRLTGMDELKQASLESSGLGKAKKAAGRLCHWRASSLRINGRYRDALELLEEMRTELSFDEPERGRILLQVADIARLQGRYDQAANGYAAVAAMAGSGEHNKDIEAMQAEAEYGLARMMRLTGKHSEALAGYDKARKLQDQCIANGANPAGAAWPAFGLGEAHRLLWDIEQSRAHYSEAERLFGENLEGQSYAFWGLGECDRLAGKLTDARRRYQESLRCCKKTGDLRSRGWALIGVGCVSLAAESPEEALPIFVEAEALLNEAVERAHLKFCLAVAKRRLSQADKADFDACLKTYTTRDMAYCMVQVRINQALLPSTPPEEKIRLLDRAEQESATRGFAHELKVIEQARAGRDLYAINLP